MAGKAKAKKKAGGGDKAQQGDEELLKHPVMMYPPFTPVMITAQRVPFYADADENSKVVGEARMKEVVPVLHSQGPWLMTVANYEEAWFQADWVAEVEQDAPDQYFKDQQVITDAFEERADQTEEGEPVKTETRSYMEMAEGYGMMVMPQTNEELFVQAYAELVYAFEPNAELMGTYKHIMNVFSPDSIVELEDYITMPAEIQAGEKTGEGPLMPEQRRQLQQEAEGGGAGSSEQRRVKQAAEGAGGDKQGANEETKTLGTLADVSPAALKMVAASWGVDLCDVELVEDPALRAKGVRGAVRDAKQVRLAPGQTADVELLLEELAHIVQFRNAARGELKDDAPRDPGGLEAEAKKAVEAAVAGKRFEIEGGGQL